MGLDRYWKARRVFMTGATGFKGAWLSLWLESLGADQYTVSLPPDSSYPLYEKFDLPRGGSHHFADIRDAVTLSRHLDAAQPEIVIHMAAQALVRRSYSDPIETYTSNVLGTVNLLEAVRKSSSVKAVLVVTSDKVYANDESGRHFSEGDRLGGKDPYSTSKACTELICDSYRDAFFRDTQIKLVTARAGNVIGGGDWAEERLVPDIVRASAKGDTILLRFPHATRPWQHVLEPLSGYLRYIQALAESRPGAVPNSLNFGPSRRNAVSVSTLTTAFQKMLGLEATSEQDVGAHPREATLLTLNSQLASDSIGWQPRLTLEQTVEWTAEWYLANREGHDMREFTLQQIARYGNLA
ncbi:CDP-glucose 4,6-dehydratase [Microvirga rosea]|uniref:CDP-glucose 4,6-dehydratase n=1 Tax=Microvirga rosea TaxID=2715425 RepID=UPI001D0B7683|nr:CDP-glucose 4,6-dehydratase [Microvirga rosea]MCB8823447.1 CDP-glucose 4,6-dehydratase [Microvirga rosea]